jgi:hypothetical protein
MGRPSKYKPEFAAQVQKLAELGATDQEIADFFEADVRTIYRWKHDIPAFCQALKGGKDIADDRVERSLYQRAIGYEQEEVKIFMPSGADNPVYAPYRAKVAPDVTAAIFWLKNRRKEAWRDVSRTEHTGKDGAAIEIEQKVREDADAVASAISSLAERARAAGVAGETQH